MDSDEQAPFTGLSAEEALRGVDVETEADDDSDEEALPTFGDGKLAPALADMEGEAPAPEAAVASLPTEEIPGLDVETEADDDSGEPPLPLDGDEIAPALFASDESQPVMPGAPDGSTDSEISRHIDDFFEDSDFDFDEGEDQLEISPAAPDQPVSPALSDVESTVGDEVDDESIVDMEDRLDDFLSEEAESEGTEAISDERFAVLKATVDSLKEEITGEKIADIESDLQEMKEALADKPIEKTLTHLIGAVVGNIGKRSGDFDDEAVVLLNSVFTNLEKIRSAEVDQNQALIVLSNETANILQWQQRMLNG